MVAAGVGEPAAAGADPPPLAMPPPAATPTPPPPEQTPVTLGWHMKPSPQSAAALQGSCHLNAHVLVVVVVHVDSVLIEAPTSHPVFAGQAPALPPAQDSSVCSVQTIPAPQSPSPVQGFGSQVMTVWVVPVSSAGFGQATSGGHVGSGATRMVPATQA
jgi:hypothetical protein